jgi:hypothetical protein
MNGGSAQRMANNLREGRRLSHISELALFVFVCTIGNSIMSRAFETPNSCSVYDDTMFQDYPDLNPIEGDSTALPWLSEDFPSEYSYILPQAQGLLVPPDTTETSQFSSTQNHTQASLPERPVAKSRHSYGRAGRLACTPCRDAKRGWVVSLYSMT